MEKLEIFTFCHDLNSLILAQKNTKLTYDRKYYKFVFCGNKNEDVKNAENIIFTDNGQNISQYNRYFNEFTGMYWLAKNYDLPEFVGLQHYRRIINVFPSVLKQLDDKRILIFNGYKNARCDEAYDTFQSVMDLNKDIRIVNYENEDVYPEKIKNLICPFIQAKSKGVQYKYLSIMPKKVFLAMVEFFEPVVRHYIKVIDSNKYQNIKREFGYILEYLFSHFVNIYSMMFDYDVDYSNNSVWNPCGLEQINAIPKRLIFIWLGNEVPDYARFSMYMFQKVNPDYEIMFIRDDPKNPQTDDLKETLKLMENKKCRFINEKMNDNFSKNILGKQKNKNAKITLVSDCFRAYVLNKYGGIYLDCDTFPIKPFDDNIRSHKNFITYCIGLNNGKKRHYDIFCLGCEKGNFAWKAQHNEYAEGYRDNGSGGLDENKNNESIITRYKDELEEFKQCKTQLKIDTNSRYYIKHFKALEWSDYSNGQK